MRFVKKKELNWGVAKTSASCVVCVAWLFEGEELLELGVSLLRKRSPLYSEQGLSTMYSNADFTEGARTLTKHSQLLPIPQNTA